MTTDIALKLNYDNVREHKDIFVNEEAVLNNQLSDECADNNVQLYVESNLETRIDLLRTLIEQLQQDIKACQEFNKVDAKELEEIMLDSDDYGNSLIEENKFSSYDNAIAEFISPEKYELNQLNAIFPMLIKNEDLLMDSYFNDDRLGLNQRKAKMQLEERLRIRRKLAAQAYKHELLEIEKLCNEEMMRVKQNVSKLEPLAKLVSDWHQTSDFNKYNLCLKHDLFIREVHCSGVTMSNSEVQFSHELQNCNSSQSVFLKNQMNETWSHEKMSFTNFRTPSWESL